MFEFLKSLFNSTKEVPSRWRVTRLWSGDPKLDVGASVIRLAAVAHRTRIELPPLIERLAEEHRGLARYRLRRLHSLLERGTPLVDALEQTPDLVRDEDLLSLRCGVQTGILDEQYTALVQRLGQRGRGPYRLVRQALKYGLAVVLAISLIVAFMMVLIAPTFVHMLTEFGLEPPSALTSLLSLVHRIIHFAPMIFFGMVVLAVAAWLLRPIRWFSRWYPSRILPSVAVTRRSQIQRLLGSAIEAGRPVAGTLSTLARYHFDPAMRLKLLYARNEMEQGASVWESVATADLLSERESRIIGESSSPELQSWMLKRLADTQEDRVVGRRVFWSTLVHPAIVVVLGAFVLWICVGFFSVLLKMIFSLV